MRIAEFKTQAGLTLYAEPLPSNIAGTGRVQATEDVGTGVYRFQGLTEAAHGIYRQIGADPDPLSDTLLGALSQFDPQGAIAGQTRFATIDPEENASELPAGFVPVGNRAQGNALIYTREESIRQTILTYRVVPGNADGYRVDWAIGFDLQGGSPASLRLLVASIGDVVTLSVWDGTSWNRRKEVGSTQEPSVVEIPLVATDSVDGKIFVRFETASADLGASSGYQLWIHTAFAFVGSSTLSGEEVYPDAADVRAGVEYGPNGNDFTGIATDLGELPGVNDVREGIGFGGALVGALHLPPEDHVAFGYEYGGPIGEFVGSGNWVFEPGFVPPVNESNSKKNLVRGDSYNGEANELLLFTVDPSAPEFDESTNAKFGIRTESGVIEFDAIALAPGDPDPITNLSATFGVDVHSQNGTATLLEKKDRVFRWSVPMLDSGGGSGFGYLTYNAPAATWTFDFQPKTTGSVGGSVTVPHQSSPIDGNDGQGNELQLEYDSAADRSLRCSLSSADTRSLPAACGSRFDVQIEYASGAIKTNHFGTVDVLETHTDP